MVFICCGIIFLAILCLTFLIGSKISKEELKFIISTVFIVFSIITVLFFCVGFAKLDFEEAKNVYNNGYHECGGEWIFKNASRSGVYTYYYFECDNCGMILETTYNFR